MRFYFTFILNLLLFKLSAQKFDNNWIFGNHVWLNFSSNPPKELPGAALATLEGSASISDENGNLLFYTDGVTVWNKNHQIMENGAGLNGHRSATQSALILKTTNDENMFYLFTVGEKADANGLNYHLIDISKNNGLGSVVMKNKKMLSPVTEKLTATLHQNKKWYWLIVKQWNTNIFYSYLITGDGVEDVTISKTGPVITDFNNDNIYNETIGYMTISESGNLLATVNNIVNSGEINLYKFNNATGLISHIKSIKTPAYIYGAEFSPNEKFLYVTFERGAVGLKQYDLESGKELFSINSEGLQYGALRLAPDGKIYITKSGKQLDVIDFPDGSGENCQFKKNAITLTGSTNGFGLPNKNFYVKNPKTFKPNHDTPVIQTRHEQAKKEKESQVQNTLNTSTKKTNLYLCKELKPNLGEDKIVCGEKVVLKHDFKNVKTEWNTGDTTNPIKVNNTGYYWVTVSNNKCYNSDTIFIKFLHTEPDFKFLTEFNPNNNGVNAKFIFSINDVEYFEMKVYNKNNKLVFETHNPNEMWDGKRNGKPYPDGDYKFIVKYKSPCPNTSIKTEEGIVRISK